MKRSDLTETPEGFPDENDPDIYLEGLALLIERVFTFPPTSARRYIHSSVDEVQAVGYTPICSFVPSRRGEPERRSIQFRITKLSEYLPKLGCESFFWLHSHEREDDQLRHKVYLCIADDLDLIRTLLDNALQEISVSAF